MSKCIYVYQSWKLCNGMYVSYHEFVHVWMNTHFYVNFLSFLSLLHVLVELFASFAIHAPSNPPDEKYPFPCKTLQGTLYKTCNMYTNQCNKLGHFAVVNRSKCELGRKMWSGMPLPIQLSNMSTNPVTWHGNGVGKLMYKRHGHAVFNCLLNNMGMNELEYVKKYSYD